MNIDPLRHALSDPKRTISSESTCKAAAAELETAARSDILDAFSEHSVDPFWVRLGALWTVVADALDPSPAGPTGVSENAYIALALGAAKFERNLIAGVYESQTAANAHGADIRRLIFNVTTFVRIKDPNFFTLQAILAQLLCNLASPIGTEGQRTADEQLKIFLSGNREDDVIIRLLDSREIKVNIATLHLLNNLTADSPRLLSLLQPAGIKWLSQLLARMDDWLELEDGRFEVATTIISGLIDAGAQADLFTHLSVAEEPVTPSQVTLLKLVDAWLDRKTDRSNINPSPNAFLLPVWHKLAAYTTASMNSGQDDGRLGSVLVGLILATEGLSNIVLAVQARVDASKRGTTLSPGGDEAMVGEMKSPSTTIVPRIVALLGATHTFLPRVKPTKDAPDEPLPFANIKRDLVRLLAALAFDDVTVGDAVRAAGGVELVLSMCETDDRNPYLREHALLCVRNLMLNNLANQEIVKQLDPVGVVGENGELLPLPEKLKQKMKADKEKAEKAAAAGAEATLAPVDK